MVVVMVMVMVRVPSTGTRGMRVVVGVLARAGRPVMMVMVVRCGAGGLHRLVLLIAGELGRHGRNVSCECSDDRHGELHVGSVDKNPLNEGTTREVARDAGRSTKIIRRRDNECKVERAEDGVQSSTTLSREAEMSDNASNKTCTQRAWKEREGEVHRRGAAMRLYTSLDIIAVTGCLPMVGLQIVQCNLMMDKFEGSYPL
jgi:hypothetical protein